MFYVRPYRFNKLYTTHFMQHELCPIWQSGIVALHGTSVCSQGSNATVSGSPILRVTAATLEEPRPTATS